MKKVKAQELTFKPFLTWFSGTFASGDPLVINESDKPELVYGVCPWKIVAGELVNRTPAEMEVFENEWIVSQKIAQQTRVVSKLENSSDAFFTFLSKDFPMNQTARLYYLAMQNTTGKTEYEVMATNGMTVEITAANKADFLEAYFEKLLQLTQPEEIL